MTTPESTVEAVAMRRMPILMLHFPSAIAIDFEDRHQPWLVKCSCGWRSSNREAERCKELWALHAMSEMDTGPIRPLPAATEQGPVAREEPMDLHVALDFADNPRPYHTLQAPADTNGELYEALRVLAAAYRASPTDQAELIADLIARRWRARSSHSALPAVSQHRGHQRSRSSRQPYHPRPEQEHKMNDEAMLEQAIQDKGLNAPRLSPTLIDKTIVAEQYHVFPGTTLTVAALTLRNGYVVTGTSAAASPENFDEEIGRRIARGRARDKIWDLEAYLLREKLAGSTVTSTAT